MKETSITLNLRGINYSFIACVVESTVTVSDVRIGAARVVSETRLAQVEKLAKEFYPQYNFVFSC